MPWNKTTVLLSCSKVTGYLLTVCVCCPSPSLAWWVKMRPCQSLSEAWCLPAITLSTPSTWPSSRRWSRGWHCGECVCVCRAFFVSITRHRHSSGHSGFLAPSFTPIALSHGSLEGFQSALIELAGEVSTEHDTAETCRKQGQTMDCCLQPLYRSS